MKHDVLVRRAVVLAGAVALGGLSDAASAQQLTLKIATVNAGDNPRNVAAAELAKQLSAKSGGKIKGEVYTNNQLAKGEAARHDRHGAGGRGADRRHLRAGLPAAVAAVPVAEPAAGLEGDGRTRRHGAREKDGGEGPDDALLRRRL